MIDAEFTRVRRGVMPLESQPFSKPAEGSRVHTPRLILLMCLALSAMWLRGASPARASAVCPSPPTTLAGLIAPDATETGPLTEAFQPIYGVYYEAAAGCWPTAEITVVGFVAGPEGLGGVRPFTIAPAWFLSLAHFVAVDDRRDSGGPIGPFFRVAVPPSLESSFDALNGQWIRVSGHFNDRRAKTCVASPTEGSSGVPTPDQAIAICRTAFVITSARSAGAPATDTVNVDVARDPTPNSLDGALVLAAVAGAVAAFIRFPRARPGRRVSPSTTSWRSSARLGLARGRVDRSNG
jgi:hypothetical protein